MYCSYCIIIVIFLLIIIYSLNNHIINEKNTHFKANNLLNKNVYSLFKNLVSHTQNNIPQKYYCNDNNCIKNNDIVYNQFTPPVLHHTFNKLPTNYTSIMSRNKYDSFQLHGLLINNESNTIFKLFGRKKYGSSSLFEYYLTGVINDNDIKLPIETNKEIYDKQEIIIPQLNNKKFIVTLYETNNFKYYNI